jgi:hypothetical protein
MSRFGMTGRVIAKADRQVDIYVHVDRIRDEVYEHVQRLERAERRIAALEAAERERLTETGVLRTVRDEFSRREIGWMKWAVRGILAGLGTALLGVAGWVIKLAYQGLTT